MFYVVVIVVMCVCVCVYSQLVAYMAVSCHMTLVHELGAVAAVVVGNARKAVTIVLSFILFPKPFSVYYVFGVILVFGSVILNVVFKEQKKIQQKHHREFVDASNDANKASEEYP